MRSNLWLRSLAVAVIVAVSVGAGFSPAVSRPLPGDRMHVEVKPWVPSPQVAAFLKRLHDRELWRRFVAHLRAEAAREAARRAAEAAAQAAAHRHGACGGDLPPCYVMMRESGGNPTAQNPHSSASGKWQFVDGTWARFGGYAKARYAPEWVQDDKARLVWDHGRGCHHWSAC